MFTLAEFTARDGMPEADRASYNRLTASLEADLRPSCFLETLFAAEILRATWRVQRLIAVNGAELADNAARAELERSIASARKSLRWATSELRKLQTDREIKEKLGIRLAGIADIRQILKITGGPTKGATPGPDAPVAPKTPKPASDTAIVANMETLFHSRIDAAVLRLSEAATEKEILKKRTHLIPRNAPCTCGSGEKHKRCCGKDAPPVPADWLQALRSAA